MKVHFLLTIAQAAKLFDVLFKNNLNDDDYILYYNYPVSSDDYQLQRQLKKEFMNQ